MSDMNSWHVLRSAMQAGQPRRPVQRDTWRRVLDFAAPQRRRITIFLILATTSAVLGVATPVLAGSAVNAIVDGDEQRVVIGLAVLIAVVALADAAVGLLERWTSSQLGENLILDLRRRVFEHVQSMPIAFFTRTHTGALVSRLNNDVIGAQRAFTSALSGVVTNVIVLVLTVVVMASLSWQITLLAVVLLPIFVIPARRIGARVGILEREAAMHNAAMTTQMTERFSAPGRHPREALRPPGPGGRRVRSAGRTRSATSA